MTSAPLRATGTFDVKLAPLTGYAGAAAPALGRMSIDKQFHGDLTGRSIGEMLSATTGEKTSAGYVAVERVEGVLHGRPGSFVLQHSATMNRGRPDLSIIVVPDSGTGELQGLSGRMTIVVAGGKHSYEFEYALSQS